MNTQQTPNTRPIKIIVLCVALALCMPSGASVFDPLLKLLIPIYQKVAGKTHPPTHTPDEHTTSLADFVLSDTSNENTADTKTSKSPSDLSVPSSTAQLDTPQALINQVLPTPTLTPAQALPLHGDNEPSLLAILQAEFAYNRQDTPFAIHLYKSQAFGKNSTAVFERALALSMQHESPQVSLAFANAWQQRHPEHTPAWFYVTHLALKSGEYQTAATTIKKILDYDPKTDLSGVFSGIFPNSPTEQRRLFDALMALDNHNASLSALKAGLLAQLNETNAAILHINTAIKLDPNNLAFNTLKANILKNTNRFDDLTRFLNTAQKTTTDPTKKELMLFQIRTLIEQGNLKDAWQKLAIATKRYKSDGDLLLLGSLVALDLQHHKQAQALLTKLLDFGHLRSQAHYYLGLSYERRHDYAQALIHYQQVDSIEHKMDAVRKIVGFYLLDDKPTQAIDELINLRDQYEMFASESYLLQADILVRQNQKSDAIKLLQNAFDEYPDDSSLLFAATSLLDDVADYDQKLANISRLTELEDNPRYKLEQARLILLDKPTNTAALQVAHHYSTDTNADIRTQARVLLADKQLQDGDYQAVIDELGELYELSPSLAAGSRLLRAYNGIGDDVMVDTLLLDLTVRFGQDSQFDATLQDY